MLRSATLARPSISGRESLNSLKTVNLKWSVGAFCAVMGALMLVAPHQFAAPAYQPLHNALGGWGVIFLLTGIALSGSTVLSPPRGLVMGIHLLACTLLLVLAAGFAGANSWTGTINYTLLGLGLAYVTLRPQPPATSAGNDLLVLVLGASAALSGLAVLLLPAEISNAVYLRARPALGLALLVGGLAVLLLQGVEWRVGAPRWVRLASHWLAGVAYLVFLAGVVLPAQAWVSILYYGGFASFLMSLPLLERRLMRLEPTMLQARVALLLIAVAMVPIIITLALVGDQEEQTMRREALDQQAQLAHALAQNLGEALNLHQATLTILASQPGLLELPAEDQTALLQTFHRSYPEVAAFALYDAAGRRVAVSEGAGFGTSLAAQPLFEVARRTGRPTLAVVAQSGMAETLFGFGVPVYVEGQFGGLATIGLEPARVTELLDTTGSAASGAVSLVNAVGQVMLGADMAADERLPGSADARAEALAMVLARPGVYGSAQYALGGDQQLLGYARVPGPGWLVLVERPAASALARLRGSRDLAFGIVLLVLMLTGVFGVVLAGWVTAPLKSLAHLARELAAGRSQAPLPHSDINEVAQLTTAFGEMRARLAARTAEREMAQAELERSEMELRQLSARLQETQEQERQRLAREVHDELGGALTGLKMDVSYLARHWGGENPRLLEKTDDMARLIDETVQTVRRIATDLRPSLLDDFGLLAALEWQFQVFAERTSIECRLVCELEALDFERESATAIFRVFQETLTNIARHAQATRVDVSVGVQSERLVLRVADNGRGLNEASLAGTRSLGLVGMRERVHLLGGELRVAGEPGKGTVVLIQVPLARMRTQA